MRLQNRLRPQLPRLAWCAGVRAGTANVVALDHGADVEVDGDWFSEAVWDKDFERDSFAAAANQFGTGGYLTASGVTFRCATTLVDRLWVATRSGETKVSNSLALILAATQSQLCCELDYLPETEAIVAGVSRYVPHIPTVGEWALEQRFYSTISVASETAAVSIALYDLTDHSFGAFAEYRDYLFDVARAIGKNAKDSRRSRSVTAVGTLSSGYDSTLATVLARASGATVAFTRKRANSIVPALLDQKRASDDGTPAAAALGMEVVDIPDKPSQPWSSALELAFLGGSPAFRERVFLPMATQLQRARTLTAVFTGYHGDRIWERDLPPSYLAELWRSDYSGITLGEARLHAGFFNVAIAFSGVAAVRDINQISNSAEMQPWSDGTNYDRPIPRRIIEEAGVPRGVFGIRKRAVWSSVDSFDPWHPELATTFKSAQRERAFARARIVKLRWRLASLGRWASQKLRMQRWPTHVVPVAHRTRSIQIYHWAVEELIRRYRVALRGG